jgi:signal transduction histidine kinase
MVRYHDDVDFEAELRAYLEQIAAGSRSGTAAAGRDIDEHAVRAYFLRRLGEFEAGGGGRVAEKMFHVWSGRVAVFARYIASLPGATAPTDAAGAQAFAERALEVAVGLPSATPRERIEQLELERIAKEFTGDGGAVERYALETGLVRDEPGVERHLTPLGTALLRLRGRDAVRWLLTCEVLQSTGRWDPWRTPRALLEQAVSDRGIVAGRDDDGSPMMPYDASLLARLANLGVLRGWLDGDADSDVFRYEVTASWRDAIQAVLGNGPWHHAIRAVLAEDRTGLVPAGQSAAEGAVEQTKLIAHEVNNALVPVRIRLDALRAAIPESQFGRIDAARRGVVRVLSFVEEMVKTSELVSEAFTPCELAALIREAVPWVDDGERIEVDAPPALVRVRAPRTRLLRSIVNLLRNAIQATPDGQAVRITARRHADAVQIVVDDAGPGIAEDARERVFHEGYTTRSDGRGYGLAYVHRVVSEDLRGRVWCERSDLSGARFVIELPGIEVEP